MINYMRRLPFNRKSWILPLMKEPSSIVHHKTGHFLAIPSRASEISGPLLGLVRFSSQASKSCSDADYVFKFGFRAPLSTGRVYNNLFLQVFIERMDLENAMRLMSLMKENGCKPYERTYDELILMFRKVEKLDTASAFLLEMLDQGFIPNKYHISCLIDGLCKHGRVEAALLLLEKMEAEYDFWPETEAYYPIIYLFYKCNLLFEAQELLEKLQVFHDEDFKLMELVANGQRENCMLNVALYGPVTCGLCSEGRVDEAKMLLDEMERKQVVVNYDVIYTWLINGYVSLNRVGDAFLILMRMVRRGLKLKYENFRVLRKVLDKHVNKSEYTMVDELWKKMMNDDDDGYMYVPLIDAHYKRLICGLYKNGDLLKAISVFKKSVCRSKNVIEIVRSVFIDGVLDQLVVDDDECLDFIERIESIYCGIFELDTTDLEELFLEFRPSCDDSQAIDNHTRDYHSLACLL